MAGGITPSTVMAAVDDVMLCAFDWGECDCCTAACDVFARLWGMDPIAQYRGYRGQRAALQIIRGAGGLGALAAMVAMQSGLTDGHAIGGLALACNGRSLLVCIEPGLWAGKTETGYALVRAAGRGWHIA